MRNTTQVKHSIFPFYFVTEATELYTHQSTAPTPPNISPRLFVEVSAPGVDGFRDGSGPHEGDCGHVLVIAQGLHYFASPVDLDE